MHPIRFEAVQRHDIRAFHYLPGDDVVVSRHWQGPFEGWPEEKTPSSEWAVNDTNMEEVAVYVGLVWRLTACLARYAIPVYQPDDAAYWLGRDPVPVDWQYEVDAGQVTAAARDNGFVPGYSDVRFRRGPTGWEVDKIGHAGLFPLATPRDLVSVLRAVVFNAPSEITVFAVAPGAERFERLAAALRGPVRPALADVLGDDGIFVDLTIGSEQGNYDSVIVASRTDLRGRLTDLVADYTKRVESYEQRLDELRSVSDFLRAMPALAGVDLDAS